MTKFDDVVKKINKQYKSVAISAGYSFEKCKRIPFTSPRLNYLLYGGLPVGKIVEIFGNEGSGKTTLSLDIIGQYQLIEEELHSIFVDLEHSFDAEWAKLIGVDVGRLQFFKPEEQSAEKIFDYIIELVATGAVGLVVLDSVPTLLPDGDVAKDCVDNSKVGGISKPLRLFLVKILGLLSKNNCTLILINQSYSKVGARFPTQVQPGGGAPKYYSSVRLHVREGDEFFNKDGKKIEKNDEAPKGHEIRVEVAKSKVSRNDRKVGYMTLMYETGIDAFKDTIDTAMKFDLISVSGSWYEFNGQKFQGKHNLAQYLKENIPIFIELYDKVNGLLEVT